MSKQTVIIYGALSNSESHPQARNRILSLKRRLLELRDIYYYRLGSTKSIDYRNYDLPFSTNTGDVAISEATRRLLLKQNKNIDFVNANWGELPELEKTNKIIKSSVICMAGSGYFHFSKSGKLDPRVQADLIQIERNNLTPVLFGVGVNMALSENNAIPSLGSIDATTIRDFLKRTPLISVRDKRSKILLQGLTDKEIELTGDPAITLAGDNTLPAQRENIIGINFSFHGPHSNEILKKNITKYISMLKEIRKKTGCEFYYFKHYCTEDLIPKLLASNGIQATTISGTPDQLIESYKKVKLHIGGMLHSCILATSANTPCIGLAYDIKHFGFFETMKMEEMCFLASNLCIDNVIDKSLEILDSHDQYLNEIQQNKQVLANRCLDFSNKVNNLICTQ